MFCSGHKFFPASRQLSSPIASTAPLRTPYSVLSLLAAQAKPSKSTRCSIKLQNDAPRGPRPRGFLPFTGIIGWSKRMSKCHGTDYLAVKSNVKGSPFNVSFYDFGLPCFACEGMESLSSPFPPLPSPSSSSTISL